jgi:replicative DNA helicase
MSPNGIKPPYDLEAEKSVLSSIMLDRDALIKAAEVLQDDDFYDPIHKIIYKCCRELFEQSHPVDIVTIKAHLSKTNEIKRIGGIKYLSDLISILPFTTNIEFYSKIIKDHSIRRKVIGISGDLVGLGMDESKKIEEIIDEIEKRIFSIAQKSHAKGFVHIKDVLMDAAARFEESQGDPNAMKGISTGFKGLDAMLGGFHKGDLVIIAARPSVGKSALMLECVRHMAVDVKKKVAVFSLEMGKESMGERLLSLQSGINLMDIRMGANLTKEMSDRFYAANNDLYEADILIDDTPGQHISEIRTKCRKLDLEVGIDAIFVDYLQLIHGRGAEISRALEVTDISQSLKNIARELKVPVIALAQLNRAVETRTDRRPQLSDLRESGSIEQDADVVMFISREGMHNRDLDESERDKAEVIIAKHRNGATGGVPMRFIAEQAKYVDATE